MREAKAVKPAHAKQQKDSTASHTKLCSEFFHNIIDQYPFYTLILYNKSVIFNRAMRDFLNQHKPLKINEFTQFIHPEDKQLFLNTSLETKTFENPFLLRLIISGKTVWFSVQIKANTDQEDHSYLIFNFMNIDHLQKENIQIKDQLKLHQENHHIYADTDVLTGLLNRQGLKKALSDVWNKKAENTQNIGLMLIGLDHFKNINDTLGYQVGDYVLSSFSKQLTALQLPHSIIGRLGSDEFVVVLTKLKNRDEFKQICHHFLNHNKIQISYKNQILHTSMSIGCAFSPTNGSNLSELLQCADIALNDIKMSGRGDIRFFHQDMFNVIRNKALQLDTAYRILQSNIITPFYQPKVELETGKIIGLEALMRWHCPKTGQIQMPETVKEAFNDYELATKISANMQNKVFNDITAWKSQGKNVVPVAINAAPIEFFRDNYAETLLSRLYNANISPQHIEVEITEHLFSACGLKYVTRALNKLKEAGVKIALDDFGTGYSSLTHLRDLPVNYVKIDYSFIHKMTEEKPIAAIVEGIIQLASILGMEIIAEGIENQAQLEKLIKMKCHYGQGFLFRSAMTPTEVIKILN